MEEEEDGWVKECTLRGMYFHRKERALCAESGQSKDLQLGIHTDFREQ